MDPRISLIIPFTERDEGFERALISAKKALAKVPEVESELIEIDDSGREGVSAARNKGLIRAKGEWVVFLDADDELAEDFFPKVLMPLIDREDLDLISCGYTVRGQERQGEQKDGGFEVMSGYSFVRQGILNRDTHVWAKAMRREALPRFDESLTIGEDMLFLADLALAIGKRRAVAVTGDKGYIYTLNPKGAMGGSFTPSYLDELRSWRLAEERLMLHGRAFTPYDFAALEAIRIRTALMVPLKISALPEEEWRKAPQRDALQKTRETVRDALSHNGVFAALSIKEKAKTVLFLASPTMFMRMAIHNRSFKLFP